MFRWLAERYKGSVQVPACVIDVQADGYGMLLLRSEGDALELLWQDIVRVRGYKRDLISSDSIVLEFERTDGSVVWSWEEDPAFDKVIAAAERFLAGFPRYEVWHAIVAFPPFDTRNHTLWGKPTSEAPGLPQPLSE